MTLHRTHASLAMAKKVHAAMTTPTNTSASKPKSQLAVPQAHQVHQALEPLGASMTLRRTRASLAMAQRAHAAMTTPTNISALLPKSRLAVAQAQALQPLGASMT